MRNIEFINNNQNDHNQNDDIINDHNQNDDIINDDNQNDDIINDDNQIDNNQNDDNQNDDNQIDDIINDDSNYDSLSENDDTKLIDKNDIVIFEDLAHKYDNFIDKELKENIKNSEKNIEKPNQKNIENKKRNFYPNDKNIENKKRNFYPNDKNFIDVESEIIKMRQKRFNFQKSIFVKHLQKKIDGIENRMRYINHKYSDYQKHYSFMNVLVILLSSMLTLFEALTNILDINEFDELARTLFGVSPLLLSTIISLLATLIKFRKFQEKMESLSITEEKGIIAISKLKRVREYIYFSKSTEELETIKKTYIEETYQFYNEVNVKIEIELDEDDYIKYYKKISKSDVSLGKVFVKKIDKIKNIINDHYDIHKEAKEHKVDFKETITELDEKKKELNIKSKEHKILNNNTNKSVKHKKNIKRTQSCI